MLHEISEEILAEIHKGIILEINEKNHGRNLWNNTIKYPGGISKRMPSPEAVPGEILERIMVQINKGVSGEEFLKKSLGEFLKQYLN